MKIVAALLIILFLAFSGYHLSFRSFRLPVSARTFYLTGTEFIFFGLLLGPIFFNILDPVTVSCLEPLTAVLLGWIGLLCGFQFEIREIRRFSGKYLGAALAESTVTFLIVAVAVFCLMPFFIDLTPHQRIFTAIMLGASASCSSQTGLLLFTDSVLSKRSELIRFMQYISSINALAAFFFFLPAFIMMTVTPERPSPFTGINLPMLIFPVAGICLIFLYNLFLAQRRDKKELLIVIIGMVLLTSGAASSLKFSPLLANFLIGMFLVNTTREKERIFRLLISIEKPLYLLLLVFIGACWQPDRMILIPGALAYCLIRILAKMSGGFLAAATVSGIQAFPRSLGFGLIEQGGLPLAILYDFSQSTGGEFGENIISAALIGIILTDLLSPFFISGLLKKGETGED